MAGLKTDVYALILGLLLAGCSFLNPGVPTENGKRTAPPVAAPVENGLVGAEIGVQYPFKAYTHCGLDSAQINDEVWLFEGQPTGNPPPGFDNPVDAGSIVLIDTDHATYTSSHGVTVKLTRGGVPRVQGCM